MKYYLPASQRISLIFTVLLSVLLLVSCAQDDTDPPDNNTTKRHFEVPIGIQAYVLPEAGTLSAQLLMDGVVVASAPDVSETAASVTLSAEVETGSHTFTVVFRYTDTVYGGPFELARASKPATVSRNSQTTLPIADTDYTYADNDNDGISNLAELDSSMRSNPGLPNPVTISFVGDFTLQRGFASGIAVQGNTAYVTFVSLAEMDTYSTTTGNYVETITLSGATTYLGGYTGATTRESGFLYLTAMYDSVNRYFATYLFTTAGNFVSSTNFPGLRNSTGIAFDGTYAFVNQNDSPLDLYRLNPVNGNVLDDFTTNPGHGQRLGIGYWANQNLLIESYDSGISVISPTTGEELQHFTGTDLGYSLQTNGVEIQNDTLYLLTSNTVYFYTLGRAL